MKYKITINVFYGHEAIFIFDDAAEAMRFMQLAAEHLVVDVQNPKENTKILLEVIAL